MNAENIKIFRDAFGTLMASFILDGIYLEITYRALSPGKYPTAYTSEGSYYSINNKIANQILKTMNEFTEKEIWG